MLVSLGLGVAVLMETRLKRKAINSYSLDKDVVLPRRRPTMVYRQRFDRHEVNQRSSPLLKLDRLIDLWLSHIPGEMKAFQGCGINQRRGREIHSCDRRPFQKHHSLPFL